MGGHIATLLICHLKELHLASCTNCFSSLYDAWFERRSPWKFFASYTPNPVHAPLLFRLPWAGWILPNTTKLLEHSQKVCIERHALHIMCQVAQTAFRAYMTGSSKEKVFGIFRQLRTTRLLSGYPGHAHYKKAFGTFLKGMLWRTLAPHHG